ncbi:MAG: hypothetical protein ACM31C_05310 [Acidobacteriota bacterium]
MTRRVAIAVAICLAALPAWGHSFPPVRTVVVQVEAKELVLLVGYRPASGAQTEAIVARAASQPRSRARPVLRDVLEAYALAPLAVTVDGTALVPTSIRAKLAIEPGSGRPGVVVLITYALPVRGELAISSKDPRSTRISWQDRGSCRVELATAPAQDRWFTGVASFLLTVGPPCATPARSPSGSRSGSRS